MIKNLRHFKNAYDSKIYCFSVCPAIKEAPLVGSWLGSFVNVRDAKM